MKRIPPDRLAKRAYRLADVMVGRSTGRGTEHKSEQTEVARLVNWSNYLNHVCENPEPSETALELLAAVTENRPVEKPEYDAKSNHYMGRGAQVRGA